ncbi:hypothetical protein JOM56_015444 [Amanita muscaria]
MSWERAINKAHGYSSPQLSIAVDRSIIPRPPGELPTPEDIACADFLHERVRDSTKHLKTTDEDLANVIVYKSRLVAAAGGIPPHWLEPALREIIGPAIPRKTDIRDMKRDMQTMKDDKHIIKRDIRTLKDDNTIIKRDIQTLKDDNTNVGEFKINLAMTRRLAAISHNARVGSTSEGYEIDPNSEPHNLPPLTSMQAILNLGDAALDAYMRNYYPNNRGAIRDREQEA